MSRLRFDRAIQQMRSREQLGFDFLREHADAYVDELVAQFGTEQDHALRCLLLELVAEARSACALPLLAAQLAGTDEALQFWGIRGLEMLDTPEADRELDRARVQGWIP
ncbi:MAG: hypothetical protein ABIS86_09590 [Streptosporangiaceae bacterium]